MNDDGKSDGSVVRAGLAGAHYGSVRPCAPHRYSTPRGSAAWSSPFHERPQATTAPLAAREHGTTGSHVPHQSPGQAHAISMPDTTWPVSRHPPGSSRAISASPVSMSSVGAFDTSTMDRSRSSSWPTPDALTARLFPRRSPPTALDRSSSGWFAAFPYRTAAEDHQPHGPAPPSPMQHRINQPDLLHRPSSLRSWHTLPGCVLPESPRPGSPDRRVRAGQQPSEHHFHAPSSKRPQWQPPHACIGLGLRSHVPGRRRARRSSIAQFWASTSDTLASTQRQTRPAISLRRSRRSERDGCTVYRLTSHEEQDGGDEER